MGFKLSSGPKIFLQELEGSSVANWDPEESWLLG
jgi:hypothetical protein